MNVCAGGFSSDVAGVGLSCSERGGIFGDAVGGGDLAVECHGGLEGDEGKSGANELRETLVKVASFGFEDAFGDFDSGGAESVEAFTGDERIGIAHGGDDASDPGCDDGIGAGVGASAVTAGLEIDIESVAASLRTDLFEG